MEFDRTWSHYINGEFLETGEETLDVIDPATSTVITQVPKGSATDIERAIDAANTAFEHWRWTAPEKRGQHLYSIADIIDEHHDELVELEIAENGKPRTQAVSDVSKAAAYLRFYAGAADKFYGEAVRDDQAKVYKKIFEPYGVVGLIIPWNWPPLHTAQFTAVALATGNTVVLKPAPETPLSSLRFAELVHDVLPDGVFNVVSGGTEPGRALANHEEIDMLAFTGNDQTGERVLEAAAKHINPVMAELGGKNAEIVFPDANLEKAVAGAVVNCFYNSGQACSDTERLLLHSDIREAFLDKFTEAVDELMVGDGRDDGTEVGPLISDSQQAKVRSYFELAEEEGATRIAQAAVPDESDYSEGYWVRPTVFDGITPEMRVAQEEVFGPFVGVLTFEDEDEAIEIANGVDFGLTGTVWTQDLNRAHRLSTRLEAGIVAINNRTVGAHGLPFGGYKRSGIGRKSDVTETMREFTRIKSVHMDLTDDRLSL